MWISFKELLRINKSDTPKKIEIIKNERLSSLDVGGDFDLSISKLLALV